MNTLKIRTGRRAIRKAILSCRIVIAAESAEERQNVDAHLRKCGFLNILHAATGDDAIRCVKEHAADLLLLDRVPPLEEGFSVCALLRRDPTTNDIPIIVHIETSDADERERVFFAGATDLIQKPVHGPTLIARVEILLENRLMIRGLREDRQRMVDELSVARHMQQLLLPNEALSGRVHNRIGLRVGAIFEPSAEVSGDLWGVIELPQSRLAVFIFDFAGHGTVAAINSFRLHAMIGDLAHLTSDPSAMLAGLNDRLAGLIPLGQFATMLYGVIDPAQGTFSYAAAGTTAPLLKYADADGFLRLDASGLPLGIVAGRQYEQREAGFPEGAALVLYSDALIECHAEAGTSLNETDVEALALAALIDYPQDPKAVASALAGHLSLHTAGDLSDDLTIVCLQR